MKKLFFSISTTFALVYLLGSLTDVLEAAESGNTTIKRYTVHAAPIVKAVQLLTEVSELNIVVTRNAISQRASSSNSNTGSTGAGTSSGQLPADSSSGTSATSSKGGLKL